MTRLRKPALAPPAVVIATPLADNPAERVTAFYHRVWRERMAELPFLNARLSVEALGFQRLSGDWLGMVITPWCVQVLLAPGGGSLWQDIPAGERRLIELPVGALEFIADAGEAELPNLQYCPLMAPVEHIANQAAASGFARDALATLLTPRPPEPAPEAPASPSRRGFLLRQRG